MSQNCWPIVWARLLIASFLHAILWTRITLHECLTSRYQRRDQAGNGWTHSGIRMRISKLQMHETQTELAISLWFFYPDSKSVRPHGKKNVFGANRSVWNALTGWRPLAESEGGSRQTISLLFSLYSPTRPWLAPLIGTLQSFYRCWLGFQHVDTIFVFI